MRRLARTTGCLIVLVLAVVAAALAAAGEGDDADELLDRASREQAEAPTYYGGALTALARALLTTDRLGACPPT